MFEMPIPTDKGSMSEYSGQYPIKDMILARKYLIEELYNHPAGTDLIMNIKKKIGLFTSDVIDYFLEDKKPAGFVDVREEDNGTIRSTGYDEFYEIPIDDGEVHQDSVLSEKPVVKSNEQISNIKYSYISRDPRDYKWVTNVYKQPLNSNQECSRENKPPPSSLPSSAPEKPPSMNIDADLHIKQLNVQLNMSHACAKTFCPRAIRVIDPKSHPEGGHNVNVCDFCHWSSSETQKILAHLNENHHASASVYMTEGPTSTDETPFKSFDKLKILKSRSSRVGSIREFKKAYVFCPCCLFCFGHNIQACATHYECTHRQTDRVYSVAHSFDQKEIIVTKKHSCCECKAVFKRLSELSKHIKESRHEPFTNPGQINLFKCPIDTCIFQSIDFTDFKTHLLQHKYFQEATGEEDRSLKCTVLLFNRPIEYYHIPDYNYQLVSDAQEQFSSIDQSIDSMKGHSDHNELLKLLRIKKMDLLKLQPALKSTY